jgi:hypothetical protein
MSAGATSENPFAGQGSVLLDIGGDVGALVVTTPSGMEGVEVEIRPASGRRPHGHEGDGHTHHPHVAVVNRPVADTFVPSLVFPELTEGHYELCLKGTDDVHMVAEVTGGVVTQADWGG